ncbi:MAG TPA: glutamate cyclase domain-containing protein, partial [Gemmataceae bacterium]|nr:glutamate cyclase domain-containing protein [Gemmataceae bacterium]
MSDPRLTAIRDLIQEDVGNRGLRTDPQENLVTACPGDFEAACRSIAEHPSPAVGVVTGFFIPHSQPPAGETDGPLGALFLARALAPLGVRVVLATDAFAARALEVGLEKCGLRQAVPLVTLPSPDVSALLSTADYGRRFADQAGPLTHLIALERVGPSWTPE